eukprot:TRINITY_DN18704_c0_g1_i1.p1 TRINITY_DN18704_c0_g1~~TRINITY_DN18704_c0_g1_i1.p1  ORF type:complete len:972 (-),score=120.39 TRINITY_DN18704_c0_g1_i1:80-2830(-)
MTGDGRVAQCKLENGTNYGEGSIHKEITASASDCCNLCGLNSKCLAWDWNPANNGCWLKDNTVKSGAQNRISGTLPPPPPIFPFADPNLDDSEWRQCDLPHDYVLSTQNFSEKSGEKGHAYLPRPIGWYRRSVNVPSSWKDKSVWLEFEGAYRLPQVFVNGVDVGNHNSGYTSFVVDIARAVRFGASNVIAVRLDPTNIEGEWWYPGAGIHRSVWLHCASEALRVAPWGVFVSADVSDISDDASTGKALLTVSTDILNAGGIVGNTQLLSEVVDLHDGSTVASNTVDVQTEVRGNTTIIQTIMVEAARLWNPTPGAALYTLRTTIGAAPYRADYVETRFGIRSIRFDAQAGFFVNKRHVKIKGFCGHNNLGGLGIGLPVGVHRLRVKAWSSIGANGWRMSHNEPSPALLDALDEEGIMVMDENRVFGAFDDLESMIRRDRNHPSVILWSLCNEVGCPQETGEEDAKKHVAFVRAMDKSRPVTAAMNKGWFEESSLAKGLEVVGFNYGGAEVYDRFHSMYPKQQVFASETSRCMIDRGVYSETPYYNTTQSGDECMQKWWQQNIQRDFMAGIFVWIGMDFYGEAKPNYWPQVGARKGIWDLAALPKDSFHWYQAWWRGQNDSGNPVLHLLPHWNWQEGEVVTVWAYTNVDAVELFLNGRSLGIQNVPKNSRSSGWTVPFEPGTLHAKGYHASSLANRFAECNLVTDAVYGVHSSHALHVVAGTACCDACFRDATCKAWTLNTDTSVCSLKNSTVEASNHSRIVGIKKVDNEYTLVASASVSTAGAPAALRVTVEGADDGLDAEGPQDTAGIIVSVVDKDGNIVATDNATVITFKAEGPGRIIAAHNGDTLSHDQGSYSFYDSPETVTFRVFNGLARAWVRASLGSGKIRVSVSAFGLTAASTQMSVRRSGGLFAVVI